MWHHTLIVALGLLIAPAVRAQCTPDWQPGEGVPGLDGTVNAVTTWDPDGPGPLPAVTVVGGQFNVAGKAFATNVAYWDGAAWHALGAGLSNHVNALIVYNGDLVAGMDQLSSFNGPTLRRWDGQAWQPLGQDFNGHIYALAEFNGELIMAGQNLGTGAYAIQAWNGSNFHALGTSGLFVGRALTVQDGRLILAGSRGVSASSIMAWDGSSWQPLGSFTLTVHALANLGGTLVAGSGGVYSWDGAAWNLFGATPSSEVDALSVIGGGLVAGGTFSTIAGVPARGVATWDGASWHSAGSGVVGSVRALAPLGSGFVAGGTIGTVDGIGTGNVANWDGAAWHPLGTGMCTPVNAMCTFNSELIAAGNFTSSAPLANTAIAAWNGSAWRPFAGGFAPNGNSGPAVWALTNYNGELIAGGRFSAAGGVPASNLAAFDGTAWHELGGGVSLYTVWSLCVFNGELVVGGEFSAAGGAPAANIAAWNGSAWHTLGSGTAGGTSGTPGRVEAMIVYQGRLIVTGSFDAAGGVAATNIAAWDGSSWHALGAGVGGATDYNSVFALAEFAGNLYVGGHFASAGGLPSVDLARWNGAFWTSPANMDDNVYALAVHNNRLIAGGLFTRATVPARGIASFDGAIWRPLGAGLGSTPQSTQGGSVWALSVYNGDLFAAGSFFAAGNTLAARVARWACSCYPNCDNSSASPALNVNDFMCFLNRYAAGDPYANCDNSTTPPTLNVLDFSCFLNRFALGCP